MIFIYGKIDKSFYSGQYIIFYVLYINFYVLGKKWDFFFFAKNPWRKKITFSLIFSTINFFIILFSGEITKTKSKFYPDYKNKFKLKKFIIKSLKN